MKKVAIITSVLLISCFAKAQNDVDALRYSRLDFGGTARYNSLAGAMGALGGDFSVCSTNPAGIAIYRKSEISFSPSLYHNNSSTNFFQNTSVNDKYNFNFGNFGFVLAGHNDDNDKSDWRGFAMGIGYNRLANFHSNVTVEGKDTLSTMLNVWRDDANLNGVDTVNSFGTGLAYMGGLIGSGGGPGSYFSIIGPPYGEVQKKEISTTGAVGETVFTLGGNYMDKLYIGGTIGMPRIRYSEESDYTETVKNDSTYYLKDFKYHSSLSQTGTGINFKFGAILKPVEWLRIGAAIHSPSFFHMQDQYSNTLNANYSVGGSYSGSSPQGSYNYTLTTPMRGIFSMAYVYKNLGLISVDYEMVNYANARLHAPDYTFSSENEDTRKKYTNAGNLRVGAEVRISPFTIRGGYAMYGSPYKNGVNSGGTKQTISFGLGYRGNGFYVDAAYVYSMMKEDYYLYDPQIVPPSTNSTTASTVMFTVGIKY